MKTAVISGITGQDGSYLAKLLTEKNYRVIGLIRPSQNKHLIGLSFLGIDKNVELIEIDLLNKDKVENFIKQYQPDEFYNLAAQSSVGLSFQVPLNTLSFNILSVINILESIRKYSKHTKYYQASSSEMFGNIGNEHLPLKETVLFNPVSPYAISKASAHWITVNYREAYGIRACCGILFNHESCLRRENFVIKKIISTAIDIKNKKAQNLKLGNLSIQRDWGYAPKYVEAMWLMLQQDDFKEYIICSGRVTSLEHIARTIFNFLDLDFDKYVEFDNSLLRNVELNIIYGDNSKAKMELGWDYNYTTEQLIERLIEDEKELLAFKNKI